MRSFLRSLWSALQGWYADSAPRLGASIAYYTLFAIAPVLLIIMAVAGAIFGRDAVQGEIVGQLDGLIGEEGARAVQGLITAASQPRAGMLASIIGTITMVVAATGVFLELQAALNTIWKVKPRPGVHFKDYLKNRLRSFGLVVSIGFLLTVSLAVSAALAAFRSWLERRMPGLPVVLDVVNVFLSLGVTIALFALLFRLLPDVRLRWRDVAIGACVTGLLFTVGKQLIGLYIGRSSVSSAYGAAGSGVVLLLWVYYSTQIVLFGAELTRVLTHRDRGAPEMEPYAMPDHDAPTKASV
jgi:membrane protein